MEKPTISIEILAQFWSDIELTHHHQAYCWFHYYKEWFKENKNEPIDGKTHDLVLRMKLAAVCFEGCGHE